VQFILLAYRNTTHLRSRRGRPRLVHRFIELCNARDVDGLSEVVAEGYRQHNPMVEDGLRGIQDACAGS
jgi:predicted SnoaL-like aldol condensation-catalyzing enzyme